MDKGVGIGIGASVALLIIVAIVLGAVLGTSGTAGTSSTSDTSTSSAAGSTAPTVQTPQDNSAASHDGQTELPVDDDAQQPAPESNAAPAVNVPVYVPDTPSSPPAAASTSAYTDTDGTDGQTALPDTPSAVPVASTVPVVAPAVPAAPAPVYGCRITDDATNCPTTSGSNCFLFQNINAGTNNTLTDVAGVAAACQAISDASECGNTHVGTFGWADACAWVQVN